MADDVAGNCAICRRLNGKADADQCAVRSTSNRLLAVASIAHISYDAAGFARDLVLARSR